MLFIRKALVAALLCGFATVGLGCLPQAERNDPVVAYLARVDAAVKFVQAVQAAQLHEFLMSLRPPGYHTDAWWWGVAVCEEGGNNHPYFGYFGKIDGAWGGLDWNTQVRLANELLARAGFRERLSQGGPWADHSIDCAYRESPGG